MGLTMLIDKKRFYSLFTLSREVSYGDFKSGFDHLYLQINSLRRMPIIWDFRRADLSKLRRPQLENIVALVEKKMEGSDGIRIASVVNTDLQYGLSRLLQFYMDENIVTLKTFRNFKCAVNWVCEIDFIHCQLPFHIKSSDNISGKAI